MGGWPADGLSLALHLVTSLVHEGDMLYDLLLSAAVEHAPSLLTNARFTQLLRAAGPFAEHFLAAVAARHARELAATQAQLGAAQRKCAALQAQLDERQRRHAARLQVQQELRAREIAQLGFSLTEHVWQVFGHGQ
jgi:Skp family chaperone for outer membrane proteins